MKIQVFDIGDTGMIDRYTVIIDNDVYGMSINPLSPQGFNQYCCPTSEVIGHIGKEVDVQNLPEDVQIAILKRIEDHILGD